MEEVRATYSAEMEFPAMIVEIYLAPMTPAELSSNFEREAVNRETAKVIFKKYDAPNRFAYYLMDASDVRETANLLNDWLRQLSVVSHAELVEY